MAIEACAVSHMGRVRLNNEDSVSVVRSPGAEDSLIAIVADGMGGHEGGETASRLAVDCIARSLAEAGDTEGALLTAIICANRAIFEAAKSDAKLAGMGTTCVAVAIREGLLCYAWVGDSRLYLLRGEQAYCITEDHSVVNDLMRRGLLSAEEARSHPDRSVLSRALGTHATVNVSIAQQPMALRHGDRLLLCSDGLHDLVAESELAELGLRGTVARCSEALVQRALDRGGFDNVSVVLAEVCERAAAERKPAIITRELTRT